MQIQTLLLIILGAIFVSNEHYHQLLGNTIKHVGGGLIFTGLLYLLTAVLGYYSAHTQNKFLLLVVRSPPSLAWRFDLYHVWRTDSSRCSPSIVDDTQLFVLLSLLLFLQILFGSIALGKSVPAWSHEDQVSCLTVGRYDAMTTKQQQDCDQFLHSDTFAGMTLVWQSYYTKSITKSSYRAMVLNFQKDNFCCGNGLPIHCRNDTRSFPSSYPSTAISSKVKQRVQCDSYGTLSYTSTKDCNVNGRCEYDLPYGSCGLNPVTTTTRGCGAFVFSQLSTQVKAISITVLLSLMFPVCVLLPCDTSQKR